LALQILIQENYAFTIFAQKYCGKHFILLFYSTSSTNSILVIHQFVGGGISFFNCLQAESTFDPSDIEARKQYFYNFFPSNVQDFILLNNIDKFHLSDSPAWCCWYIFFQLPIGRINI